MPNDNLKTLNNQCTNQFQYTLPQQKLIRPDERLRFALELIADHEHGFSADEIRAIAKAALNA